MEAAPVLYEINVFQFSYPRKVLRFLNTMGSPNIAFLHTIRVFVEAIVEGSVLDDWCKVFEKLGKEAAGLRRLEIYMDQEPSCGKMGLGHSERFIRALSNVKTLEYLDLGGFFKKDWLEYVKRTMGVTVTPT